MPAEQNTRGSITEIVSMAIRRGSHVLEVEQCHSALAYVIVNDEDGNLWKLSVSKVKQLRGTGK